MSAVYKRERPYLVVERTGGAKLGNCYNASYETISCHDRMTAEKINAMRDAGVLSGYGQEFYIKSQCDGEEEPAGHDEVMCVDSETGEPATNPYSNKLYGTKSFAYYEYKVEHRVDSGG